MPMILTPTTSTIELKEKGYLQLPMLPPLSLYVHMPWCLKKCPYCDFNSHAIGNSELPVRAYMEALLQDLEQALHLVYGRRIQTIFFGGGTPSLFSPDDIDFLLSQIRARLPWQPDAEITLEANPGTFETERFANYRQAGINRLSIGLQSFNDAHLKTLGRVHNANQSIKAVEEAAIYFENWNLDLMYALPHQTLDELRADLNTALAFSPPHLSIYHLTIEPNTYFAAHPPPKVDEDLAHDMLDCIEASTAAQGLYRYEISAFARSNHNCQHNTNYWEFGDYLGIGAGAHSKISFTHGITRQVRYRNPELYIKKANEFQPVAQIEEIKREALPFEFMLNALRLKNGFPIRYFYERTGLALTAIEQQLQQAEEKKLITRDFKHIQPTQKGLDFLTDLQMIFLPKTGR